MSENEGKVNSLLSAILTASSGISITLMATGLLVLLSRGEQVSLLNEARVTGFREALAGALRLDPLALMTLGIIILISTPFIRVVGAFFSFLFVEKDKVYAFISLGVILILILSIIIPGISH